MSDVSREIGRLEAQVQALTQQVSALSKKIEEVNVTLATAKGGWAVLMGVAGLASVLGGLFTKYLSVLTSNH